MRYTLVLLAVAAPVSAWPWPEQKRDRHGDPLPPGAVLRLGKIRPNPEWRTVEYTPDGRSIAVLTWGKYLSLFDRASGRLREARTLPTGPVRECRLFPDCKQALLVRRPNGPSAAPEWEVWDLGRGERTLTIAPAGDADHFLLISPDGRFVATVQLTQSPRLEDGTMRARLWEVPSGKELRSDAIELPPIRESSSFTLPAFSPTGDKLLMAIGRDRQTFVYCWNTPGLDLRWRRVLPGGNRSWLAATTDSVLVSGESVVPLNLGDGKDAKAAFPPDRYAYGIAALSGDGRLYLYVDSGGERRRLKAWDWKRGRPAAGFGGVELRDPSWPMLCPSPDGKHILVTGRECRLYDLATGRLVWGDDFGDGHTKPVTGLAFAADGRRLASAGQDQAVRLWDVPAGRPLGHWSIAPAFYVTEWTGSNSRMFAPFGSPAFDLSSDGRRLVFAEPPRPNQPQYLCMIDLDSGKEVGRSSTPGRMPAGQDPRAFGRIGFARTADSVFAVFGAQAVDDQGPHNTLARWDFTRDTWVTLGQVEQSPCARSAMGRDGRRLLTAGTAYGLETGRRSVALDGAGSGPIAVTVDGKLAAGVARAVEECASGKPSPNIDGLRVWEAGTGATVARLPWNPPSRRGRWWAGFQRVPASDLRWAWPRQMALNPTGRGLATADVHGVRLWDLVSGRVVSTLPVPIQPPPEAHAGSAATALAFTPDGTRLATGLPDGTVLFWPVPKPEPNLPRADELDGLWADLIGSDAARGWRAAWRLEDDPAAAVRLIRTKLRPAEPVPIDDLRRWLADVDAPDFRRREAATKKLEAAIDRVVPAVTEALKAPGMSPEARERLKKVLAKAPDDDRALPAWAAGLSRAVAVLEHSGTPDGQAVLRELAAGAAGAWLTREAEAATDRLRLRRQTAKDRSAN